MSRSTSLARAFGYPYPAPAGDFLLRDGAVHPLAPDLPLGDRVAVLGVGSNRAPEQLRRKFGDQAIVPVTTARLRDHDVVYSAHMASYGSIPATLIASPGTMVTVALTWLTTAQLQRMHETEAIGVNYDYGEAAALPIERGHGRPMTSIGCYLGRRGALALDGAPVALAEVRAEGRRFATAPQSDMIARVHASTGERQPLETWLEALIGDRDARTRLTETLRRHARPIILPAFEVLPVSVDARA